MIKNTRVAHCPRSFGLAAAMVAAGCLLQACASTPAPTAEMAVSAAAVAHAVDAGAPLLAPGEMRSAREQLDSANAAMATKDYDLARRLAQRAQADAQLAEAKSASAKAQQAADDARKATRALTEEMARKTP